MMRNILRRCVDNAHAIKAGSYLSALGLAAQVNVAYAQISISSGGSNSTGFGWVEMFCKFAEMANNIMFPLVGLMVLAVGAWGFAQNEGGMAKYAMGALVPVGFLLTIPTIMNTFFNGAWNRFATGCGGMANLTTF